MKKLLTICLLSVAGVVRADVVDIVLGDTMRRVIDIGKGNYVKAYLCIKGDLSDVLGKSHQEILDRVSEIAGIKEAAIKKGVKHIRTKLAQLLGAKTDEDEVDDTDEVKLTKIEQRDITHGRDAAAWCLTKYADKFAPDDLLSVVRNRDNHGILRYKVSYIGKVVADKSGEKQLKKVAS